MLKSKRTILGVILCAIMVLCFCIGVVGVGKPNTAYALNEHDHGTWNTWGDDDNEKTSLPTTADNYVLAGDITLLETWNVPEGTTNLCLNGYVIKANCTEDNKFSVITVGEGATLNLYDCGNTSHNGYVDSNGLWHLNANNEHQLGENETSKAITGGIITGGNTTTNGGGVTISGTFNMYGGTIAGNTAQNGGGVSNIKSFTMAGGNIVGNIATTNGGGVYASSVTFVNLLTGGTITDNTAQYGGGVYYQVELCFAQGTLITMADGKTQAIEKLNIGDSVRVFDHEKGEISSSKIFDVWTYPEKHSGVVKLYFSNDIDVTVVYGHSFFEREQNKYVAVTRDNVSAFVGHEFYNVDNERWETLKGYEFIDGEVDTYVITTEYQLNCVANGMLTNEDGFYTMITNIFDYGDDLKIDESKKESDIYQYGIYGFENLKYMSRETYEKLNFQYLNVAIGKGMITTEEISCLGAYWSNVDSELFCDEKEETPVSKSGLLKSPFKAPLLTSSVSAPTSGFYVGGSIKIFGNNGGNLYLSSEKTITIGTGTDGDGNGVVAPTKDMNIGITLADGTGKFTINGTADYLTNFFADNTNYGVYFDNAGTESTADDFFALGYTITNACPEEEDDVDGYLTVNKTAAASEEIVTITITIKEGYKLTEDSLTVTYYDGERDIELELTEVDDDTYTFTMVAYPVSITAEFEEKQTISISETQTNSTYNGYERAFQIQGGEGESAMLNFTFTYYESGDWTTPVEPIIAGSYNVEITRAEDDTYKAFSMQITDGLVIAKAEVEVPTIASKTYVGNTDYALTADVAESELYEVTENNGGINAGEYDVKLTLTDSLNYKWATTDNAEITLKFIIDYAKINKVGFGDVAQPVATETAPTSVKGIAIGARYTGTISWSPELFAGNFDYGTVYTATITLDIVSSSIDNYRFADNFTLVKPTEGWTKSTDSTDTKIIYTKIFTATEVCEHSLTEVPYKPATCTEDGYMVAYYCSVCERYFTDCLGEDKIGDINAYNAWKLNDGKISAKHIVNKIAGTEPTIDRSGYKDAWKCSECNEYFEDENCTKLIGDETAYNNWKANEGCLPQLQNGSLGVGVIIAICVGGLLLLLIIIYLIGYFFLYRKGKLDERKIKVIYKILPRGKNNLKEEK